MVPSKKTDRPVFSSKTVTPNSNNWMAESGVVSAGPGNPSQVDLHLCDLLDAASEASSNEIALVYRDVELTYAQLAVRVNTAAAGLRQCGVGNGAVVALQLDRGIDLVVCLLAVLHAGGAYLPLTVRGPLERAMDILTQARPVLMIAESDPYGGAVPVISPSEFQNWSSLNQEAEFEPRVPSDLAYVLFTSGSTGTPKGVMIEHAGVANRLEWMHRTFDIGAGSKILQKTPYTFDVSVWELLLPLISGATLVMAEPEGHLNPAYLAEIIAEQSISHVHFVPSMLGPFLHHLSALECRSLRQVFCSGERLSTSLAAEFFSKVNAELFNLYGPTEASIDVTAWECQPGEERSWVPIGTPIDNMQTIVLDEGGLLVADGLVGELYLSGIGLARGYLNRTDLTDEAFIYSDLPALRDRRMYRTGDLVRRHAGGVLEYCGRIDRQVKVRGNRVELGDIESAMLNISGVVAASVESERNSDGVDRIVARFVPSTPETILTVKQIRASLQDRLQDYMIPSVFLRINTLPVTASGKFDAQAARSLPSTRVIDSSHQVPSNKHEEIILGLIITLLGLENAGTSDDFYELGGDSILGLALISQARAFEMRLTTKDIQQGRTAQAMAVAAMNREVLPVSNERISGEAPLTPIQLRWMEENMVVGNRFSMPLVLQASKRLELESLRAALGVVFDHHEALSTTFTRYTQKFGPSSVPLLEQFDKDDSAPTRDRVREVIALLGERISLEDGPVVRIALLGDRTVVIVAHHLVMDGVSWRILAEDLDAAYGAVSRSDANVLVDSKLPPKTHSMYEWGSTWRSIAVSDDFDEDRKYWFDQYRAPEEDKWPAMTAPSLYGSAVHARASLSKQETRELLRETSAALGVRIDELLIAAVWIAICRHTGEEEVFIEIEGHGREFLREDLDLSRTLGWFTSIYPVVLTSGSLELQAVLRSVRRTLRAIPRRGTGYGLLAYGTDEGSEALINSKRPTIKFNYLGQFGMSGDHLKLAAEQIPLDSSTSNVRTHAVDVVASVEADCLVFDWEFDAEGQDPSLMEDLSRSTSDVVREYIAAARNRRIIAAGLPDNALANDLSEADLTQLALKTISTPDVDRSRTGNNVVRVEELLPTQLGMLTYCLLDTSVPRYVVQAYKHLDGPIREIALAAAIDAVTTAHESLRTTFEWKGISRPVQVVHHRAKSNLTVIRDLEADEPHIIRDQRDKPFVLDDEPPTRWALLLLRDGSSKVVFTHHHLILDGLSVERIWKDLESAYLSEVSEIHSSIASTQLVGPRHPAVGIKTGERQYWRERVTAMGGIADLRVLDAAEGTEEITHIFDEATWAALQLAARTERVSLISLMHAAWILVEARRTRKSAVTIGCVFSGRPADSDIAHAVGNFINTLPLHVETPHEVPVAEFVRMIDWHLHELSEHQRTSLGEIVAMGADMSRGDLFASIVIAEDYLPEVSESWAGLRPFADEVHETAHYSPTLVLRPTRRTIIYRFSASSKHDGDGLAQFVRVMRSFAADTQQPIGSLSIITDDDNFALEVASGVLVEPVSRSLVTNRIRRNFNSNLSSTAVTDLGLTYTNDYIRRWAQRCAGELRALGITRGSTVVLHLSPGVGAVVAVLAVWLCNATYVPVDPNHTSERLAVIVEEAGASAIITHDQQVHFDTSIKQVTLESSDPGANGPSTANPLVFTTQGEDLAYVIYTSGTTGKPKGVPVTHAALAGYASYAVSKYLTDNPDPVILHGSLAFDMSITTLICPMMTGNTIEVCPPQGLPEMLNSGRRFGLVKITPSHLQMLRAWPGVAKAAPSSRVWVLGGESLSYGQIADWLDAASSSAFVNEYGPTETVVGCVVFDVHLGRDRRVGLVPIGRAIPGAEIRLLNVGREVVSLGETGEIYIGGQMLADPYLGSSTLSAERFVSLPQFGDRTFYKSGDLAYYDEDRQLVYLGRADDQIKLNGFRIEPGEVESAACRLPFVTDAKCVVRPAPDGKNALVLYTSPELGETEARSVAEELRRWLPSYMVPELIVSVPQFPRGVSGKIDLSGLPAPDWDLADVSDRGSPVGLTEQTVADSWAAVLAIPPTKISAESDFFELGGHSLLATSVIADIQSKRGVVVPLAVVFQHRTVRSLASWLDENDDHDDADIQIMNLMKLRKGNSSE